MLPVKKDVRATGRNVLRLVLNRTAKLARQLQRRVRRGGKDVRETGKRVRAEARQRLASARDSSVDVYRGAVRAKRYSSRFADHVWPRLRRDMQVRAELRRVAKGTRPIIVGPWLSEVGYEVLYWVPFLRWFCQRYRVDRSRLVVVSRGGVAAWYADVADRYVELLDLFEPVEFARLNSARSEGRDQKQHAQSTFDRDILDRVRARNGLSDATVCHPSTMFRLLSQFWLGNESLEYLQEHLRYARVTPPAIPLPELPDRFAAVKLYTGKALPDTAANRRRLRALVERLSARLPVVTLDTRVSLDEHEDYLFRDIPGVISAADWSTPQNNLAIQTVVLRSAEQFVGTCGSVAWLAPMLGTSTLAVYSDDDYLGPHLYAARAAYRSIGAAPFTPFDLNAVDQIGAAIS